MKGTVMYGRLRLLMALTLCLLALVGVSACRVGADCELPMPPSEDTWGCGDMEEGTNCDDCFDSENHPDEWNPGSDNGSNTHITISPLNPQCVSAGSTFTLTITDRDIDDCWTYGEVGGHIRHGVDCRQITWNGGGLTGTAVNDGDTFTGTAPELKAPKTYTVEVTWQDTHGQVCGCESSLVDAGETKSITVTVKPPKPVCEADEDCGGGGCSTCPSGAEAGQMPGLARASVSPPNPLPGPVRRLFGLPGTCSEGTTVEPVDSCDGYWFRIKKCGHCEGVFDVALDDSETETLSDGSSIEMSVSAQGEMTYTLHNADGSIVSGGADGPTNVSDPDGNSTTVDYGSEFYNEVTTPEGDVWRYYHGEDDDKITRAEQVGSSGDLLTGATSTQMSYYNTGAAANKLQTVAVKDSSNNTLSQISYTYDASGRMLTATKGDGASDKYKYCYDYQVANTITVTQQNAGSTATYSTTEYYYIDVVSPEQHETHVTRIDPNNSNNNQETVYSYYYDTTAAARTVLKSVTDPLGNKVAYTYWGNDQTSIGCKGWVGTASYYDPTPTLLKTVTYSYNTVGAGLSTTITTPGDDPDPIETNEYYDDAQSNDTIWLKQHRDARGNFTYYERDPNNLSHVTAVKVSPPADGFGNPPTDQEWAAGQSPIKVLKQYAYYSASDQDVLDDKALVGQLKTETVPDVEGTTDQVTEYKYWETVDKIRTSPTQTIYQYWNGSSYEPQTSTASYDDFGRVVLVTDALNGVNGHDGTIAYEYDDLGRQTKTIYAAGVETENHYSTCCGLVYSEDEEGRETHYAYDDINRVTDVWNPGVSDQASTYQSSTYPLVHYTYDAFGNIATVTTRSDASTTRVTSYTYDKLNRVTKIEYPDQIVADEEFIYDDAGRLVLKKDGNDSLTAYEYDTLGRLLGVDYEYAGNFVLPLQGFSANVTYGYEEYNWDSLEFRDGGGSLKTSMTDSTGTSRYYYDSQGQLSRYVPSVKNPDDNTYPYVILYEYNNLGQKTATKIGAVSSQCSVSNPFKYATCELIEVVYDSEYEYYANGWLKSVSSGTSTPPIAEYTYDAVGNRTGIELGNGTSTEFVYDSDPRFRLNTIAHKLGAATLASIDYTDTARDKVGNPKSMTDWTGTWSYGYDSMNRLTSATAPAPIPNQPAGGSGALAYGYDWVGNRIHPPSGSNPMVYNAADQLTSWPGMHQYTYYPDGSLEHVTNAGGTSTLASYTYTPDGLLSQATFNGRTLTNTWDADTNRVTLTTPGATYDLKREFVYDPTAGIPAVVQETQVNDPQNPNDDVHIHYFREPNGSLIARVEGSSVHYYHFDALGSTRLLTTVVEQNVVVSDKYAYDAYGALISHDRLSGSVDQPYQYVGQLGYYTHWQEPDFGLLQLGVRFYDAEVGRFTQRDPIGASEDNGYAYCWNSPAVLVDPDGLKPRGDAAENPLVKKCLDRLKACLNDGKGKGYGHGQGYVDRALIGLERILNGDASIGFGDLGWKDRNKCKDCTFANAETGHGLGGWYINLDKDYWKDILPCGGCMTLLHELIHAGGTVGDMKRQHRIECEWEKKKHGPCEQGPYETIAGDMWHRFGCSSRRYGPL